MDVVAESALSGGGDILFIDQGDPAAKRFYAVSNGRDAPRAVYKATWDFVQPKVSGVSKAGYRGFPSRHMAEDYLQKLPAPRPAAATGGAPPSSSSSSATASAEAERPLETPARPDV
jgi:viroplasmin and RNaseH domain-containing protein